MSARRRFAVVGTGARAETFIRSLVTDHADRAELVALADVNPARIRAHNRWHGEIGHRRYRGIRPTTSAGCSTTRKSTPSSSRPSMRSTSGTSGPTTSPRTRRGRGTA